VLILFLFCFAIGTPWFATGMADERRTMSDREALGTKAFGMKECCAGAMLHRINKNVDIVADYFNAINQWRIWDLGEAANPVNYLMETKHARNKVIARSERMCWATFCARVINKDKKSVMKAAVARLPLLALPDSYREPILKCFEAKQRALQSPEEDKTVSAMLADAAMVRGPLQLYHKAVVKRSPGCNPTKIWAQVKLEYAAMVADGSSSMYVDEFKRLENLRHSHKASIQSRKPLALCDRLVFAGPVDGSRASSLALCTTGHSASIVALREAAHGMTRDDLALTLCSWPIGVTIPPDLGRAGAMRALPGCLGRPLAELSKDDLLKVAESIPVDLTLMAYLNAVPKPIQHCLPNGSVMDPRADVVAKPLATRAVDQHLAKRGRTHFITRKRKKEEGEEPIPKVTKVSVGATARQLDFISYCRGVAADRGVIRGPGRYNSACGKICNKPGRADVTGRNKQRMKELMRATWKRIVSFLGGAELVSNAMHLFALEAHADSGVQERVEIAWLAVCNGLPSKFYVIMTRNNFLDADCRPHEPVLPIADYAGVVIETARHAYVASKPDAAKTFASTRGRLYHQTHDEMTDRLTSRNTHHIILRKLMYTPLSGDRSRITGVVDGEAAELTVPMPKPKPAPRKRRQPRQDNASMMGWGACFDTDNDDDAVAASIGCKPTVRDLTAGGGGALEALLPFGDYDLPDVDVGPAAHGDPVAGDPVLAGMCEAFPTVEATLRRLADNLLTPASALLERQSAEVHHAEELAADADLEPLPRSLNAAHVGASGAWDKELATCVDLNVALEKKFQVKVVERFHTEKPSFEIWNSEQTVTLGLIYNLDHGSLRAVCARHKKCHCFINSWGTIMAA
jgi:hypothetical protein